MSLNVFSDMLKSAKFNTDAMERSLDNGYILATDLADYLVNKGLSFREAHSVVGKLVNYASQNRKTFNELSLKEYRDFSPLFSEDINSINNAASIASRNVVGGTSPNQIAHQLRRAKKTLGLE